jgi:hypothetical protein
MHHYRISLVMVTLLHGALNVPLRAHNACHKLWSKSFPRSVLYVSVSLILSLLHVSMVWDNWLLTFYLVHGHCRALVIGVLTHKLKVEGGTSEAIGTRRLEYIPTSLELLVTCACALLYGLHVSIDR